MAWGGPVPVGSGGAAGVKDNFLVIRLKVLGSERQRGSVPRSSPTESKMEPQITQNTQRVAVPLLQGQDDAFDLKARLAEVEQQAEMQACGFQIVQALREMNLVNRLGYLQFDEDDVFDE